MAVFHDTVHVMVGVLRAEGRGGHSMKYSTSISIHSNALADLFITSRPRRIYPTH